MIKLRLVGSSSDLAHLIYTSKKGGRRGSHLVPVDEKLFATLEDLVRKRKAKERGEGSVTIRPQKAPAQEPKIPLREIQRQLRAGLSPERVARAAGVSVAYVEQFLTPVLYERMGVVQQARLRHLQKARAGTSELPLGEAVAKNLRARRVRLEDEEMDRAWDATRQENQPWVISLAFRYRGRAMRAVWRYNAQSHELVAANRLAQDLGWAANGRAARQARSAVAKATPTPSPKKKARTRTSRTGTRKRRAGPARRPASGRRASSSGSTRARGRRTASRRRR